MSLRIMEGRNEALRKSRISKEFLISLDVKYVELKSRTESLPPRLSSSIFVGLTGVGGREATG